LIRNTRLDLETKLELMVQISKGMQYLHSQDVLHRDLKPMNILVKHMTGPNGQTKWLCKVNDFGLSKQLEGMKSKLGTAGTIGTEWYASPEVVLNQSVGARADVYSAAMTFFQLLTGRHPYDKQRDPMHRSFVDESVRPEFKPGDEVPVKLQQLVQRMWRQDPTQRPYFAEVTEFLTDLKKEQPKPAPAAAAGSGVGSGSGSSSSPSQPRARPCSEWIGLDLLMTDNRLIRCERVGSARSGGLVGRAWIERASAEICQRTDQWRCAGRNDGVRCLGDGSPDERTSNQDPQGNRIAETSEFAMVASGIVLT